MTPWEVMVRELQAERVTHSNESMLELKRRLSTERPESPHQVRLRKAREARLEAGRAVARARELRAL